MPRVASYKKKRIRKSRSVIPRGRRPIKTKSLFPRKEILIRKGRVHIKKILPSKYRMFKKFHNPFRVGFAFTNFDRRMGILIRSWLRKQSEWSPVKRKVDYTNRYKPKPFTTKTTRKKGLTSDYISKAEFKQTMTRVNDQRKHPEDIKALGLRPFKKFYPRKARHKHPWKGTNKYGPVGPLGPHLVISIIATAELTRALKKEEMIRQRGKDIRRSIESAIDGFRSELLKYAKMIIDVYVPKETGDLQNTLIEHLEKGKRRGCNLRMEIATDRNMIYAKPVNRMEEKRIQHSSSMGIIGRRSHRLLHDPKAQHGFYNHVRMNISNKAWELLNKMYQQILSATISISPAKGFRKLHPRTTPLGKKVMLGYRKFTPQEIKQGYYKKRGDRAKLIGASLMTKTRIGEMGPQRTRVAAEDRAAWINERAQTKGARLREFAKTVHKPIYKKRDIMGWFVISGLNKRPK